LPADGSRAATPDIEDQRLAGILTEIAQIDFAAILQFAAFGVQ